MLLGNRRSTELWVGKDVGVVVGCSDLGTVVDTV
jgi:hypothetical protein